MRDDIKEADRELEKQIGALVKEIEKIKKDSQAKKSDLLAKEKELKDLISKKKLIGAITIAVQCIGCCFPPAGPIVAGVAAIGLTVYNNSQTAPTIATATINVLFSRASRCNRRTGWRHEGCPYGRLDEIAHDHRQQRSA